MAGGSPHAQLPPLGLAAPQLMTFSQLPVADTQASHLPQGTAAMGIAVLVTPNSPSALGTSIPILLEQPLYPETLGAASAKPETPGVPRDRDKQGAEPRGCAPAVINQHVSFQRVTVQHSRGVLDS